MELLYDDQVCFHIKPHLLQVHIWIDIALSVLYLRIVKQLDELQLGQH
jgi:hypothetical protein